MRTGAPTDEEETMHKTIGKIHGQHRSGIPWRRRGCTLAVLGSLAGCGGGDASSLIGAAVVTSSAMQAVPLADAVGQAAGQVMVPATAGAGSGAHAAPAPGHSALHACADGTSCLPR